MTDTDSTREQHMPMMSIAYILGASVGGVTGFEAAVSNYDQLDAVVVSVMIALTLVGAVWTAYSVFFMVVAND